MMLTKDTLPPCCSPAAVREKVDPSRPVVYEGGGESLAEGCGCTELTDIVCPM